MKKLGISIVVGLCLLFVLSGCAWKAKRFTNSKNTEFMAMLSDPAIRKDFRSLKAVAMNANLYHQNGRVYFAEADIKKLNAISAALVNRLKYEYHLTASHYKIHTFIGKSEYKSCYQYYNSYNSSFIGKTCHEFSQSFASCRSCDGYIKAVRARKFSVIHATWWNDDKTIDLVDSFKLKNGDWVYMGLEISID
jgi:hypothetical protein